MKTSYLSAEVMCILSDLSKQLGTPNASAGSIPWGCGGACEGLSTPFI